MNARRGMSLAEAKKLARQLGVAVVGVRRRGEVKFHFKHGRSVVVNNRKKDASCALISGLRREERASH